MRATENDLRVQEGRSAAYNSFSSSRSSNISRLATKAAWCSLVNTTISIVDSLGAIRASRSLGLRSTSTSNWMSRHFHPRERDGQTVWCGSSARSARSVRPHDSALRPHHNATSVAPRIVLASRMMLLSTYFHGDSYSGAVGTASGHRRCQMVMSMTSFRGIARGCALKTSLSTASSSTTHMASSRSIGGSCCCDVHAQHLRAEAPQDLPTDVRD